MTSLFQRKPLPVAAEQAVEPNSRPESHGNEEEPASAVAVIDGHK